MKASRDPVPPAANRPTWPYAQHLAAYRLGLHANNAWYWQRVYVGDFGSHDRAFGDAFRALALLDEALVSLAEAIPSNAYGEMRRVVDELKKQYNGFFNSIIRKKHDAGEKLKDSPIRADECEPFASRERGRWQRLQRLAEGALVGSPRLEGYYRLGKAFREAQVNTFKDGVTPRFPDLSPVLAAVRTLGNELDTLRSRLNSAVLLAKKPGTMTPDDVWLKVVDTQEGKPPGMSDGECHLRGFEALDRTIQKRLAELPEGRLRSTVAGGGQPEPRWDARSRKLWFGEVLCKHYKKPAPKQEPLLDAFEAQGWWPPHVAVAGFGAMELEQAVKNLNRGLNNSPIRFSIDREEVNWHKRS
jgi:hypothetical protein